MSVLSCSIIEHPFIHLLSKLLTSSYHPLPKMLHTVALWSLANSFDILFDHHFCPGVGHLDWEIWICDILWHSATMFSYWTGHQGEPGTGPDYKCRNASSAALLARPQSGMELSWFEHCICKRCKNLIHAELVLIPQGSTHTYKHKHHWIPARSCQQNDRIIMSIEIWSCMCKSVGQTIISRYLLVRSPGHVWQLSLFGFQKLRISPDAQKNKDPKRWYKWCKLKICCKYSANRSNRIIHEWHRVAIFKAESRSISGQGTQAVRVKQGRVVITSSTSPTFKHQNQLQYL